MKLRSSHKLHKKQSYSEVKCASVFHHSFPEDKYDITNNTETKPNLILSHLTLSVAEHDTFFNTQNLDEEFKYTLKNIF